MICSKAFVAPWVLLIASLCRLVGGEPSSLSDDALVQIKFDQRLNQQVSPELMFVDEAGRAIRIGSFFGRKPMILVLGYYECPMLCKVMNNGLIECLQDLKATAGTDFDVISASIDPSETPELAAAKKITYLKRYGRDHAEDGWHFLTGNDESIRRLTDEVGFNYAYDAQAKEFAHPSGLIILTPEGRVSRYLFGVTYSAKELSVALNAAKGRVVSSPIQQFVLLCFHYSPLTSKYGALVMALVRITGLITLAGLGWYVFSRGRMRRSAVQGPLDQKGVP